MASPYYARKTELKIGPRKGETVYSVQAYYYGTLTTKQVATQIAQESSLTPADVMAVIERMGYYFQAHLPLGYKIKLDGIGTFYNEFITTGSVTTEEEVTAKLVKSIQPAFSAEYTIVNGTFRYTLLPEKNALKKVTFKGTVTDATEEETPGGGGGGETDPDENPYG